MIKRIILYGLVIFTAFMLQNNFFAGIHIIDCTPNLLLIVTFAFGFIRGRVEGMLIGFFCGLLSDFFFGSNVGFYALIYCAIGYLNGLLGQLFYNEFLHMPVLLCIFSDLLYSIYVYVFAFLLKGATKLGHYLLHVVMPEIVYTVIITLIVYRFLLWLDQKCETLEKRSAKKFV